MRSTPRAALLVVALAPTLAHAQDEPVEALLRRGIELRTAGRDDEAVEVFTRAWQRARSPVAAGQLGLAEQAAGRWLSAESHLREALAAADDPWVQRNRASLEGAMDVNRQHVGQLDLRCNVAGAAVRIDGAEAGRAPFAEPLRLLLGTVTVDVTAEGHHPVSRRVTLSQGVTREVVELRPRAPDPRPAAPATPPPSATSTMLATTAPPRPRANVEVPAWTWALAGVGVAGVVAGTVLLVVREDAARDFNGTCPATPGGGGYDARCAQLLSRGDALAIGGGVGLGVGAAMLVGAGVAIAWTLTRGGDARAFACAPSPAGLGCALRF